MERNSLKAWAASPRRLLVACLLAVSVAGCAGAPPATLKGLPQRVEISSVPFYRGNANHSGAMALAALLSQQGAPITPGLLDKPLGLPQGAASLGDSIPRVAREYGMVVYPLEKHLDALLTQVAAGNPVLLRYQEGSAWWSEPRYAVLIGYDRYKQRVLLRSGMHRRQLMAFDDFAAGWAKEGHWAVLVQPPRQLPAQVDRQRWLQAADELARAGQEVAAKQAVSSLGK
ncbi:peptidase C39 family protein [Pseudomonas putida]|uniref:peptidase C39 family protein n=1 Tax=Pseudomonas TaxID=286 RepID=UPI0006D40A44|nr:MULTISPECIES: peptidase C39 family protein [Pseudomonas]MBI6944109.1 peptidase C39 family protein [Pseudomonas putida]MBI6960189.1 peptidase C39 family protein [Pseudomonas putida]PZQ40878.1 MAG: peptidase C39 family protein [Pseudomonas putida]